MSQYTLASDAWPGHISLSMGWDPERETYFARVIVHLDGGHAELAESGRFC